MSDTPKAPAETAQRIADLEARLADMEHRFDSLMEWTAAVVGPEARDRFQPIRPRRFHPPVRLPLQPHPFKDGT